MKLFPHILNRVGGWSIEEIEQLRFQDVEYVIVLLQKEKEIENQFQKTILLFQDAFQKTEDYRLRAFLTNAQKDFKKSKFSFVNKIRKRFSFDEENQFVEALLQEVETCKYSLDGFENMKVETAELFEKDKKRQFNILQSFGQKEEIQKGILQSSQSLFQRNKKFSSNSFDDIKKKEKQTARTLAQYFYRVSTKTSPFSFFTTLGVLSEKNKKQFHSNQGEVKSFIQINNLIFAEIRKILLQDFSFSRKMKLQLNPSLSQNKTDFVFIKNEKNIEVIQRIEKSDIFNLIFETLENKELSFDEVISQLSINVDAEEENLVNYLFQIIETGFLEWYWEMSGLTIDWEIYFKKWLLNFDDFLEKEKWLELLSELIEIKNTYAIADASTRFILQNKTKQLLEQIGIQNMIPELIFFEDVKNSDFSIFSENEILPVINSTDKILRWMEALVEDEMKNKIAAFWNKNLDKNDTVPLIDFYEKFYQYSFEKNDSIDSKKREQKEDIKNKLKEIGKSQSEKIDFFTEDLQSIFSSISKTSTDTQYSGLFQFYVNDKHLGAVLNGVTPGFGKLFGRFLPLFEKDVTIELQNWNKDLKGNQDWVENTDASFFNANLHPSFLEKEIESPNGQNQSSKENTIQIHQLEVAWSEIKQRPILQNEKSKNEITTFDFGFEHPSNRSPMFQLLNGFSLTHGTYHSFLELLNTDSKVVNEKEKFTFFPRVVIDDRLVLQRKHWEVTASFFPKKEKQNSDFDFYYKIQKWKEEKNWRQVFFIKIIPTPDLDKENLNKDFFKPQFIDLDSPLAIVLLQNVLQVENAKLRIEEALPHAGHFLDSNGRNVSEWAVQWKC